MARKWIVTLAQEYRFNRVRSAGREFVQGVESIVHENEPGWEEILGCRWLEADEIDEGPTTNDGVEDVQALEAEETAEEKEIGE